MIGLKSWFRVLILQLALVSCIMASMEDFYGFSVLDHNGEAVSLEKYRGKISLVVNVASQCGYTETSYRALTKLHDILSFGGHFTVLAFPCNQFGEQEPGSMSDILDFVKNEYKSEFPIFQKIDVIGEKTDPAFKNLIEQSQVTPAWNFHKYLVNGDGKVIKSWPTETQIENIFDDIQRAVVEAETIAKVKQSSTISKDEL